MSPESPFEPGFDPAAHGFSPAPDPKAVKPRLQRPKLSPEERAERKAAKRAARGDNGGAHTRAAQTIVDPDEREASGRALYAEIATRKAILIAQRQALTDGPPYDVDKLNAELGARFNIEALVAEHYDSPGNREYRKARNAPGFAYSDELDRLRREIDALSTEQIEISWAYASPATLAAFEARRPAIEAAEAEAKRLYNEETVAILRQWQEEGARFVSIIDIPDPRQREGNAKGEARESGAVRPFVRTGKLHLPASKLALGPEPELNPPEKSQSCRRGGRGRPNLRGRRGRRRSSPTNAPGWPSRARDGRSSGRAASGHPRGSAAATSGIASGTAAA